LSIDKAAFLIQNKLNHHSVIPSFPSFWCRLPPSPLDLAYLAVAFALPIAFELAVAAPRLKANLAAAIPGTRLRTYRRTIALQWGLAVPILIAWGITRRSWSALGIAPPPAGWHRDVAVAAVALTVSLGIVQVRGIRRIEASAAKRAAFRTRFAGLAFMLPSDARECRWFTALSVTAGICEEFLFRGYLMWVLVAYMTLPLAIAVSAAIFAVGHLYQGGRPALRVAGIGVAMNALVWASGWLLPAMFIHALFNATTGKLAYVAVWET
jgi:uncharacterized protein